MMSSTGTLKDPELRKDTLMLMREVMPLTQERWLDGQRILKILDQFLGKEVPQKHFDIAFYFLNGLGETIRLLPESTYPNEEVRQSLADAVQEAKDILAAREDELLEEDEEE